MGVHPGGAELQVVLAVSPGEVVLPLPATPSVVPGPPPRGVAYVVGRSDANPRQLIVLVGSEEVRHGVSGRFLVEAEVGDVEVVAVVIERRLIQQGGAYGIGGVHDTGPGRDGHNRTRRGIRAASPQRGGLRLTAVIIEQRAHQVQFAPDLVIDAERLLAVEGQLIGHRVIQIIGSVGRREEARLQQRGGVGIDQTAWNYIVWE